jgi:hypothetical protein
VVRGGGVAGLADALRRLAVPLTGPAVVVARLSQPTPASAEVVHEVVDLLVEGGCLEVSVGSSLRAYDRDRGHRSVHALAQQAGMRGRTDRGRAYDLVDLGADSMDAPVPETAVLHGRPVSSAWAGAGTRVVVARAVTDLVDGYAGCLATLLGAAHEVAGAESADVVVDLLTYLPPTLVVVDALRPSVGADGARLPDPLESGILLVGSDALAADTAIAALLGQDRSNSRLTQRAVERLGSPGGIVDGELSALQGAHGAHPLARAAARQVAADPRWERVLSAVIGGPDPGAEVADPVLATIRGLVTPLVASAEDAVGQSGLTALLGTAAALQLSTHAWSTGFDKGAVTRREAPLGFDPGDFSGEDYDTLPDFFDPFDALLDGLPANADGMRWRLVDGATVFEMARDVAADFDEFVARVDVGAGISLMADYLGGRRVTVPAGDDPLTTGRTRQAERNLYLPQPNYLALWGGQPIDVCKIELVERQPDRHRLTWRTINSPNGSATYDDGSLTFTRVGGGVDADTRVVVRGRQLFSLPPAWAGVDLAAIPEVRNPLLEEAYRRFFTTTFDNLEACFEGRAFRIGRPPYDPVEPLLTHSADLLLGLAKDWLGGRARTAHPSAVDADADAETVDAQGFRHVPGSR